MKKHISLHQRNTKLQQDTTTHPAAGLQLKLLTIPNVLKNIELKSSNITGRM